MTNAMRARFVGKGSDILSLEGLRMLLWIISILGIPFGVRYMYRWAARNIELPMGTRIAFAGSVADLYAYGIGFLVISIMDRSTRDEGYSWGFRITLWIALIVLQAIISREYYKWMWRNLAFTSGIRVTFIGRLLPYIGWAVLVGFSFFTIIGWAWAMTAFLRWQFKHTNVPGYRLSFRGRGVDVLWRSLVGLAGMLAIIPIPWVVAWVARWYVHCVEAERTEISGAGILPSAAVGS